MSTGPPYLTVTLDVVENDLVPVDEWLNDWIVQPDMIIRDLIYQVASKEVAHTDAEIGGLLPRSRLTKSSPLLAGSATCGPRSSSGSVST